MSSIIEDLVKKALSVYGDVSEQKIDNETIFVFKCLRCGETILGSTMYNCM